MELVTADEFYFSNLVFTGSSASTVESLTKAALISKETTPVAQNAAQVRMEMLCRGCAFQIAGTYAVYLQNHLGHSSACTF